MGVVYTDNLLKHSRLIRGLTIDQVSRHTRIPPAYVRMIDEGRFADLPHGLYGRSYVRAFASAVGVDAEEALARYAAQLVDVPDPLPALREISRERTPPTLAAAIADRVREWYGTRDSAEPIKLPGTVYFSAGLDALFLFAVNAFVVAVAAHACHVSVDVLLRQAGAAMAVVCAFTSTMYFVLLAGIGGQTLGMRVFGTRLRPGAGPLDMRAIGARAAEAILGESSVVVDWLSASELPKRRESPV